MADDLWDATKLHVDWGGYRVLLELPIYPDEAHRSNHVVTVDMPLSAWGKIKPTLDKAMRLLEDGKGAREKVELGPRNPERSQGQASTNSSLRPSYKSRACSRDSNRQGSTTPPGEIDEARGLG
jgi:hypothetical protein